VCVDKAVTHDQMRTQGDDYADNSKASFEEFVADLKSVCVSYINSILFLYLQMTDNFADCRYAVFDFKFTAHREGAGASKMDKLVFMQLYVLFCILSFENICVSGVLMGRRSRRKWCTHRRHRQSRRHWALARFYSFKFVINIACFYVHLCVFQVSDESEMSHRELFSKLSEKYQG
jgi:hypothetical protein